MHNNIMAAGPYIPTTVIIPAKEATNDSPVVPERTSVETILNMFLKNKEHYESGKEAIHLLLTGIGDEIYSTVDACKTTHEMWIAIERLQQGECLNIQDVKTNLFWEFRKFTSHDEELMESYYSRFYKMINEMIRNNLTVATMQVNLFDVLKQYQKEVNEIRAERIAKNANPLALVASAQQYPDPYYQAPKSHKSYAPPSKQSSSTRSNATTKLKGKEIAKPITPLSESASEEDSDLEQAKRDKDMQKNLALVAKNKNVDTTPRYKNDNQTGQFGNQRTMTIDRARETVGSQETKRVKDYTYHKEMMLLCKQAEKGVPLQVEQADWLADMDEEIDEQELEAHYSFMAKIQEVLPLKSNSEHNTCVVEKVDSNVIPDSPDMCYNDIQTDQNAEDERAALANLIANLTLDTEENKKILKQLKKVNTSLTQELKEYKFNLEESNTTRDSYLIALQTKQTELETNTYEDGFPKIRSSVIKVQFERFINSDLLKPLNIYSRSFSSDPDREVIEIFRDYTKMTAQTFKETIIQNMNSIEQCIIERASHEQELKMTLKKLSERQLQIQQCKVQEEVLPAESSSIDTPLEQVQNHDASNVFANERRHSEQPESINDTYVLEKDDSNVTPDSSNICNNDNQVDQMLRMLVMSMLRLLANLMHLTFAPMGKNVTLEKEE
ncbi:hypothetical protein Tco_0973374 [Tanacetum coccineum]